MKSFGYYGIVKIFQQNFKKKQIKKLLVQHAMITAIELTQNFYSTSVLNIHTSFSSNPFFIFSEELRHLILTYSSVIKQYYIECLSTLDSNDLQTNIKNLNMSCTEDESILLTSFFNTITTLSTSTSADLRALRLDWFRMQAYTSVTKKSSLSSISLSHNENFAQTMNTICFHSKCVDDLESLLQETSDLSIFYFYLTQFDHLFSSCIYYPSQIRYAIAFPLICQHFINATHELCPEERQQIGDLSLKSAHAFIDEICKQIKSTVSEIANEYFLMNEQVRLFEFQSM
jgi:NCK-associated protein 1